MACANGSRAEHGRRLARPFICTVVFTALGCDSPQELDWQLEFASPSLASRATLIEARISSSCDSTGAARYTSRFGPDQRPETPPVLPEGRYGFFARAMDADCRWYAAGCREMSLPPSGRDRVRVVLEAVTSAAPDCASCDDPLCGSPAADAGADSGMQPVFVAMEAEAAETLTQPFVILPDENVSGGAYVVAPYDPATGVPVSDFRRNEPPLSGDDGMATYPFEVSASGRYRLWARALLPSLDEDSFWIKVDDGDWFRWNDSTHSNEWQWLDVRDSDRAHEPLELLLEAGEHTFIFAYRELNSQIDALLLTSDLGYVPSDEGLSTVPSGEPPIVDKRGWAASASSSFDMTSPDLAIDGDPASRWSSGQPQAGGEWFEIDFGIEQVFTTVLLDATGNPEDYPRGYELFASNDPETLGEAIASGTGAAVTTIDVAETRARYVRIVQTGSTPDWWWSIHEIDIQR